MEYIKTPELDRYLSQLVNIEHELTKLGIPYKKEGKTLKMLCPWHADTNPSLSIQIGNIGGVCHCMSACSKSWHIISLLALSGGYTKNWDYILATCSEYNFDQDVLGKKSMKESIDINELLKKMIFSSGAYIDIENKSDNVIDHRLLFIHKDRNISYKVMKDNQFIVFDTTKINKLLVSEQEILISFLKEIVKKSEKLSKKTNEDLLRMFFDFNTVAMPIIDYITKEIVGLHIYKYKIEKDKGRYQSYTKENKYSFLFEDKLARLDKSNEVIISEGLFSATRMYEIGFDISLAYLGSHKDNDYVKTAAIIKTTKEQNKPIIFALDYDVAGVIRSIKILEHIFSNNLYYDEIYFFNPMLNSDKSIDDIANKDLKYQKKYYKDELCFNALSWYMFEKYFHNRKVHDVRKQIIKLFNKSGLIKNNNYIKILTDLIRLIDNEKYKIGIVSVNTFIDEIEKMYIPYDIEPIENTIISIIRKKKITTYFDYLVIKDEIISYLETNEWVSGYNDIEIIIKYLLFHLHYNDYKLNIEMWKSIDANFKDIYNDRQLFNKIIRIIYKIYPGCQFEDIISIFTTQQKETIKYYGSIYIKEDKE